MYVPMRMRNTEISKMFILELNHDGKNTPEDDIFSPEITRGAGVKYLPKGYP